MTTPDFIAKFRRSPFARHPRLLLRKAAARAGLRRAPAFASPPAGLRLARLAPLAEILRTWAHRCHCSVVPMPASTVLRQSFSRQELLDLCQHGPLDTDDLRGDIKLIWEFSRGHSYAVNALRASTAERTALSREIAGELQQWINVNAAPSSYAWTNAMETAIRAVNWMVSDAALDRQLSKAFGLDAWIGWLWNHGRSIQRGLEARLVSSNHYLANLLGLLFLGRQLEVAAWEHFGGGEFQAALLAQTERDGGLYEASLPYHALVTEMALLVLLLLGDQAAPAFRDRVLDMACIVQDFAGADGDVFRFGDDDSGRIIPLDAVSTDLGRAGVVVELARLVFGGDLPRHASRLCAASGWWVARENPFAVAMTFGGAGFLGQGAHAHNDSLSISVDVAGRPLVVDPGSYLYTPSPADRNLFRATAAHSTLMIDGEEQRPLPAGSTGRALFALPGPAAPGLVRHADAGSICVQGPFERAVQVRQEAVQIRDVVRRAGPHRLEWCFHLHPEVQVRLDANRAHLLSGTTALTLAATPAVKLELRDGWFSPTYGRRAASRRVVGSADMRDVMEITWRLTLS